MAVTYHIQTITPGGTAEQMPVTLKSGQTIRGAGTVRGTLAADDGSVIEVAAGGALTFDELWLRDGAVVRWHYTGGVGDMLAVGTLKTANAATLEVGGGAELPVRVHLVSYQDGENLANTVWTVRGASSHVRVVVNAATKTLDLVTHRGTVILIQ